MPDVSSWLSVLRASEARWVSRAITRAEGEPEFRDALLEAITPATGNAHRIGITGAPGVGKSSLLAHLLQRMAAEGQRPGIVAVDPTSPFSGGALLADRVRLQERLPEGSFLRSMASRGAMGGISLGTLAALRILEYAGFAPLWVETVGSGQLEVDVRRIVHTVVVVLVPESGDVLQAMKAGILEIADIYVVNKADRPGAERMALELRQALEFAETPQEWKPPILLTTAARGEGIAELATQIAAHADFLRRKGLWALLRREHLEWEVEAFLREMLEHWSTDQVRRYFAEHRGNHNPYAWLREMKARLRKAVS